MKNTNKKGFTIVELVIVIAVIAILAAVLIPTFASIIKKANLSADQQAIRNMNTILATYTDSEKEISDIMAYLRASGFSYEKMITFSKGFHYCYAKTTNQMYLVDDKNEVIYPENADITLAELWSAYGDHATYMVTGITNYYATGTISNQAEFDAAFANGTFVLDLNDNVCTVNGNTNVTVKNGSIVGSGFANTDGVVIVREIDTDGDDANTKIEKTKIDNVEYITKATYTNVLNPTNVESGAKYTDGAEVTYINCVFTKHVGFYQNQKSLNLTFTECSFINIDSFAVTLQPGTSDTELKSNISTVIFDKCEFINNNRGINVNGWESTVVDIKDCTFALKTGNAAYNCVQISSYTSDATLASLDINFTNNKVSSANGVVYFHDEMTGPQALDSFKGVLNFSGNKYAEGVDKIADRGEYESGHFLYDNAAAMNELATLIK